MPKKGPSKPTGSPRTGNKSPVKPTAKKDVLNSQIKSKLVALTPRERIALKLGCKPDEFLAYRIESGGVIVAIPPNGSKHKFFLEPGTSRKGLLDASVQPDILLEII